MMQMRLAGELARRLAADSGLSYSDYVVLVVLADQPDGRLRVFELAELLGWERSRTSHQVSRMAGRGLVRKEKCDADLRGAHVSVTEAGRHEIEAAAPGHVEAVRQLFVDRLSPEQLQALADMAESVLAGLDAQCDERGDRGERPYPRQAAPPTSRTRRRGRAEP